MQTAKKLIAACSLPVWAFTIFLLANINAISYGVMLKRNEASMAGRGMFHASVQCGVPWSFYEGGGWLPFEFYWAGLVADCLFALVFGFLVGLFSGGLGRLQQNIRNPAGRIKLLRAVIDVSRQIKAYCSAPFKLLEIPD